MAQQDRKIIPEGSVAVFRCTHAKRGCPTITDTVRLPIRAAEASREELARVGCVTAARKFKRAHDLHPCVKVDCELIRLAIEIGA